MSVWGILLAFAGVVVGVNVLVIAMCAVASRSDEALDRVAEAVRRGELAPIDPSAIEHGERPVTEPPPVPHTDVHRG